MSGHPGDWKEAQRVEAQLEEGKKQALLLFIALCLPLMLLMMAQQCLAVDPPASAADSLVSTGGPYRLYMENFPREGKSSSVYLT